MRVYKDVQTVLNFKEYMKHEEIIKLLKSGDFTIAYHDRDGCSLYKGRHEYKNLPEKEVKIEDVDGNGYTPYIVELLIEALGGTSESI